MARSSSSKCIACSGSLRPSKLGAQFSECAKCGGLHGSCYKGDSPVRPWFATADTEAQARAAGTVRYFNLTLLGSQGVEHVHGWFDTASRATIQVG